MKFYFSTFILFISVAINAQAKLTIENNSKRLMTVKVMKGNYKSFELHETVTINAYSSNTIYFQESGTYFTKTKAVLKAKDPVYRKGQQFQVVNNENGYSVLTLTFSITESTVPQLSGGKQISKAEFEIN